MKQVLDNTNRRKTVDNLTKPLRILVAVNVLIFVAGSFCWASLDQVKIYKAAFEGSKPKCIDCHVDKLPKKGEGEHDFNAYGHKIAEVKETAGEITEETYKKVGSIENFETESED